MAKMSLTDKAVQALKPEKYVYRKWDGKVQGLHVVVTPAGAKSWWLNYSSPELRNAKGNSERRNIKLGTYPGMSIKDARKAAQPFRDQIDAHIDPKEQAARDRAEEAAQTAGTFGKLCDLYVDYLRESGATSADDVAQTFKRSIAKWSDKPAITISADDVIAMLNGVIQRAAKRRATGERAADQLRGFISAAWKFGCKAVHNPKWSHKAQAFRPLMEKANPVSYVGKYQEQSVVGERVLTKAELAHLWHNLEPLKNPKFRAYFKLAFALGGQRVNELLPAKWSEFDTDLWIIPFERRKVRRKSQHREPHLVPITPFAAGLLEELRTLTGRTEYLFPAGDNKRPTASDTLGVAWRRYCKATGFESVSPRDIRRSWKTLAGEAGLGKEIRDRVQGHAFQDVASKRYDRFDYLEEKRASLLKWNVWLEQLVTGESAKVIELRGRRD